MKIIASIVALIIAVLAFWPDGNIQYGPGVMAPTAPLQTPALRSEFAFNGFTLEPVAAFDVEARLLSRESYWADTESELSPVDFALGWGRMSDESVLSSIDISQGGRFYRWRVEEFPIPRAEIESHSANMHLIPATAAIEDALDQLKPGQIVALRGHLVNARREDGWRWKSSTTRSDTGAGACELFFVESASAAR